MRKGVMLLILEVRWTEGTVRVRLETGGPMASCQSSSMLQGLLENSLISHLLREGHHQALVLLHCLLDDLISLPVP